jgi:hypothetical protein
MGIGLEFCEDGDVHGGTGWMDRLYGGRAVATPKTTPVLSWSGFFFPKNIAHLVI